MKITSERDVDRLIRDDTWMMDVLLAADELDLPNWWIGAGFLRNKIWNALEDKPSEVSRDVDLVRFDKDNVDPEIDWALDKKMQDKYPFAEWEVRNQARMHYKNGLDPFKSTEDGIAHWVETATCIAVKKRAGELAFLWCYGLDDVLNLVARPIEQYRTKDLLPIFMERLTVKRWQERWPNLTIKIN